MWSLAHLACDPLIAFVLAGMSSPNISGHENSFVSVVSLRLKLWVCRTGIYMTSKIDNNQLVEEADENQMVTNSFTSRTADLERILESLGHAVADGQNIDTEIEANDSIHASRAPVEARAAELSGALDKADIFDAVADEHEEAIDNAPVEANEPLGAKEPLEDGELSGLADWNQQTADELSRIYTEIDGDAPSVEEAAIDVSDEVEAPTVELENEVSLPVMADEADIVDEIETVETQSPNALDEEALDQQYITAALQATEDAPIEEVLSHELDYEIEVEEAAEIFSVAADLAAPVSTSASTLVEDRFEAIASKIEAVLSGQNENAAMKSIEQRFVHLEEKLNAIIEYPETDAGLFALEAQMNDLKEQFQMVETQLMRIAGIEDNVNGLIEEVKTSNGELKAVAAGIAGVAAGGLTAGIEGGDKSDRLAALGDILENYIVERRESDSYAAGAFSTIQSGLDDIADYLIANDPALNGKAHGSAVSHSEVGAEAGIFEDDRGETGQLLQAEQAEQAEQTTSSAHGPAQEAFGEEMRAPEMSVGEIATTALAVDFSSEEGLDDIAAGLEIEADEDLDDGHGLELSLEEFDDEAIVEESIDVGELAGELQEQPALAPEPTATASPDVPVEPQVQVNANQFTADARKAAAAASVDAAQIPVKANEAERAGNFLASARKAAIVAAAQVEAARVELAAKEGKKKRSLFSFKLGGASPVLLMATTLLTATTAGFVYSQIKDLPVQNQTADVGGGQAAQSGKTDVLVVPRKTLVSPASTHAMVRPVHGNVHKASLITDNNAAAGQKVIINDVPHHRGEDTNGVNVPVGIVIEDPQLSPGLKQLAAVKRRQLLAKMSSDLTGGTPSILATNIALKPDSNVAKAKPAPKQNNGPTLALPPASIGPFSLRVAAAKGDAGSQFDVATRYAQGRGVKRDFGLAAKWYGRAAAQGHAIAQYRLAALYEKGHGVVQDSSRAQTWYRRSAEKGNIKAMHNFAVLHTGRNGKTADYATAAHWFKSAAEYGLADSQYNLAILYANGLGVKRDKVEAYKWFALASRGGDSEAGKRQTTLKSAMAATELKKAKKLAATWIAKPVTKVANVPHQAAMVLKKSGVSVDQNKVRLIMQAQTMLGKLGYSVGAADGKMGPQTRKAIANFQKRSGMKVTGDVSTQLVSRLSGLTG